MTKSRQGDPQTTDITGYRHVTDNLQQMLTAISNKLPLLQNRI